jgi:hypothetical protein
MTMSKMLLIAALLAAAIPAAAVNHEPNTLPKEHMTGAPGACHEKTVGDTRLQWNALSVRNIGTTPAKVVCSAEMDSSPDGTAMFGAVLSNQQANNRTLTCTAEISSGGNGVVKVARSVVVGPNTAERIFWNGEDMGTPLLLGGQTGMTCTLLPGTSLSWVWTVPRYTKMAN